MGFIWKLFKRIGWNNRTGGVNLDKMTCTIIRYLRLRTWRFFTKYLSNKDNFKDFSLSVFKFNLLKQVPWEICLVKGAFIISIVYPWNYKGLILNPLSLLIFSAKNSFESIKKWMNEKKYLMLFFLLFRFRWSSLDFLTW